MNKYDKMLELNKKKSEEKVTSAVNTIREMVESSRTSSKRVQKTQFCIVFKPVNPGDCEGVVQFNAGITGIFIMQKAEADRFLSALQDVDTIRKKEKKQ